MTDDQLEQDALPWLDDAGFTSMRGAEMRNNKGAG